MPTPLNLPPLGENIDGGDVVKVLVKPGDVLRADQPILEIETGKATLEVPSPSAGTVDSVLVKPGDKVKIGDPVLTWADGASPAAPPTAPTAAAAVAPAAAKATAAAPAAPQAPAPLQPQFPPDAPEPAVAPVIPSARPSRVPVAAAPSVRKFAREIGVAVEEVKGSGAGGRISLDDVKRHSRQINTGRQVHTHCALDAVPLPDFSKWGAVDRETMTKIRVATAEHMSRAWATIPHVTQHDKADITELESLRKRFAPRAEAAGGKLTVTSILLKVVAAALKVFPKFNASVDMGGRTVVYKKYYNLGIAVDTERGLLVPVLRGVDRKNIVQLSVELGEISRKAREGKIAPDDLQGGTFTITNLGAIGGSFFTPIINAPEVAILGVGRAAMEPVCGRKDGICAPRLMMPLSLSYDHRLIDGADGARFLRWIVEAIEEPMLISLEG
ncbi:MAG: 2-oxo acid dehydrogenase subunit E2 [Planctomycetia bacterium]|nr:2-oxo acid dehydrogenase subunit E2 [Planctomycetia bacterium]